MKKIFTLAFALGIFAAAQAQPGSRDTRQTDRRDDQPINQRDQQVDQRNQNNGYDNQRDVVIERNNPYNNDNRFDNGIMSPNRKRDMEIAQVNREYDYRIQKIKNSFFMSRWEKQRQVRSLEDQRQREIKMVYVKYSRRMDRNDDHNYPNRRY
jgi:Ni/Co efflux regulator RcnB